jgi:hypothetical protein
LDDVGPWSDPKVLSSLEPVLPAAARALRALRCLEPPAEEGEEAGGYLSPRWALGGILAGATRPGRLLSADTPRARGPSSHAVVPPAADAQATTCTPHCFFRSTPAQQPQRSDASFESAFSGTSGGASAAAADDELHAGPLSARAQAAALARASAEPFASCSEAESPERPLTQLQPPSPRQRQPPSPRRPLLQQYQQQQHQQQQQPSRERAGQAAAAGLAEAERIDSATTQQAAK